MTRTQKLNIAFAIFLAAITLGALTAFFAVVDAADTTERPTLQLVAEGDVYIAVPTEEDEHARRQAAFHMARRIPHLAELDDTHGFEVNVPEGYRSANVIDSRYIGN